MSVSTRIVTVVIITCDWCNKSVERTHHGDWSALAGKMLLPEGWERDWDADREHPPIYCSEIHMDRARQVAKLKALP